MKKLITKETIEKLESIWNTIDMVIGELEEEDHKEAGNLDGALTKLDSIIEEMKGN